ncbi:hypothetical protein FLA_6153 [Filimonas lacunae]|nr:hypothetical protein FLA_6153 [Filimonas lacunae]
MFASCKKSVPKQIKYIPKDASFVFAANAKRLNDKLEGSQVKIDSLLKVVFTESKVAPEDIKKWEDLKDAGIDWQSDIFGFVQQRGSMMSGTSQVFGAVAAVSSASKLEAYLKKQMPKATVKKVDGYSEIELDGDAVAGWNDEVLILTGATQTRSFSDDNAASGKTASTQLATLFKLKTEESALAIDPFKNFIKEKADLLLWVNSGGAFNALPMLGMTKISDLVKDSYSGIVVNFENGKVEANITSYSGKVMADMIKKYPPSAVDLDMVTTYPSNNVTGLLSVNFDLGLIAEIIRYGGFEATANQYLTTLGFTVEDVTKAFKGDMAVVFSDFVVEEKSNPDYPEYKTKTPSIKYVFNAKVGDKASYNKVLSALAAKGWLTQTATGYTPAMPLGGFVVVELNEKNMLVASDSTLLGQYKTGTGKAGIPGDVISKGKGKVAYMYVDLSKIFSVIPVDSSSIDIMNQVKATFKDAYVSADKYEGNTSKGVMELRTGNEKENSLATLVKLGWAVANKFKQEEARAAAASDAAEAADSVAVDSTVAVPVAPVK